MLNSALLNEAMEAVREQQFIVIMAHIGKHDVAFSQPRYENGAMTFEYKAIDRGEPFPPDWHVVPSADMEFPDAD